MIDDPTMAISFQVISIIEGSPAYYVMESNFMVQFLYWLHIAQSSKVFRVNVFFQGQPIMRRDLLK